MAPISDTASGMVHENEFTKLCLLGSDGKLVVYEPSLDKEGIDRMVKLVGDCDPVGVQVKGIEERRQRNIVVSKFTVKTFTASRFNLAVILELSKETFALEEFGWVIDTPRLQAMAMEQRGRLVFQASADSNSRDKYTPWRYRVEEVAGVVETIVRTLNGRGPEAVMPTTRDEVRAAAAAFRARGSRR